MSLKVAVIGMRGIGNQHAGAYVAHAGADLVGVCDIDKKLADESSAINDAKAYYSVAELLDAEELDAVSVTTGGVENGRDHYEPTMECLEAGVSVLSEKPLCNEIKLAREMLAKAREKGLYLGTNLNHRFVPPAEKAKQWVLDGKIGKPLLLNMTLWINNPNETSPWFHLRALHPHSIDIMRYFCGDVTHVQAFATKAPGRTIWSTASVNMQFADGAVGHLTGSYDMKGPHPIERCELLGDGGRFVLDNVFEELTFYPGDSDELTVIRNSIMGGMSGFGATFTSRIHRWVDQITEGLDPEEIDASGADGLAVQEIIEAAIKSIEESSVVEMPKV